MSSSTALLAEYLIMPEIVSKVMLLNPDTHFSQNMLSMRGDSTDAIDLATIILDDETENKVAGIKSIINDKYNFYVDDGNKRFYDMIDNFILATIEHSDLDGYTEQFVKLALRFKYSIDEIYNRIKYLQQVLRNFENLKSNFELLHSKVELVYENANKYFFAYIYTSSLEIQMWRMRVSDVNHDIVAAAYHPERIAKWIEDGNDIEDYLQ